MASKSMPGVKLRFDLIPCPRLEAAAAIFRCAVPGPFDSASRAPYDERVYQAGNRNSSMTRWFRTRAVALFTAFSRRTPLSAVATARLPTEYGDFDIYVFEHALGSETHVALVRGAIGDGENVITRVHSSCLTGDIFHSARCDCGAQLDAALRRISEEGRGVLLYLHQEGRGIGLANKIRAYALQDGGCDTVEANERLGFPADLRDYRVAVQMLLALGVSSIRLLSNNPKKLTGVSGEGLAVSERLPIEILATEASRRYLATKRDKLGHLLSSV
jgi:3,4-dihydroxy 2-butanone 4-phosphate synthase / GTP cyclohydrolase II